jgi:GTP-binding protein Era
VGKSTLLNALTGEKVAIVTAKPQTTRNRIAGVVEVPPKKGSRPAAQIVFVDTPGVHKPASQLDRRMLQEVYEALETRDVVLVLVDASRRVGLELPSVSEDEASKGATSVAPQESNLENLGFSPGAAGSQIPPMGSISATSSAPEAPRSSNKPSWEGAPGPASETWDAAEDNSRKGSASVVPNTANSKHGALAPAAQLPRTNKQKPSWASEDEFLFNLVRKLDCPVFLVLTKIDLVPKDKLLPMIDALVKQHNFAEVIPVSARKKDGLDLLLRKIVDALPVGERYFPKDQYTDQPQRFMVAELIRERILVETGEEVPYASAVVIERFEEPEPEAERPKKKGVPAKLPLTRIAAAIYCERDGQKAILIGKGGAKLKEIGTGARKQIESLLGTRVYLELHVIVEPNWRESKSFIESLDWRNQLEKLAENQEDRK